MRSVLGLHLTLLSICKIRGKKRKELTATVSREGQSKKTLTGTQKRVGKTTSDFSKRF